MPATVNRKEFQSAITTAGKFSSGKSIYYDICVDLKDRRSVRAFSTEGGFEQLIAADGECPPFRIAAAKLSKIINKSKADKITLHMEEPGWLLISDDKDAKFHIVVKESDDLPVNEPFDSETVVITVQMRHIESILRSPPSHEDKRPHVQAACLSGKDKAILGTNGNMLFAGKNDTIPDDMTVMIPRFALSRMPKSMVKNGDVSIRVSVFDGEEEDREKYLPRYEIFSDGMAVHGYCPYGTFPDVSDLLAVNENFDSIYVDADAMRYAVDQTFGILDMVDYAGAVLNFNETRFSIGATNPDTGEFSPYEVPYKSDVSGVKLETAFNPDYLLKALAGTKAGDEVNIMVPKDCNHPASIIYKDQTTVIMPMRL